MDDDILGSTVRQLIGEIFTRYGSIDAFCDYLRGLLDAPTLPLPIVSVPAGRGGRHRLEERVAWHR
ncbi:hypothetical protein [Nocardia acidivorans]|uniref:hypothetical protein n=1 Tax=Nocardia acidivorans TaxID=404580 RepID=UPI0008325670|nr:hypothetical protein [Nocardia acidivorans]